MMYQKGETIRLKAIFHDYNGEVIDPSNVTLTFYDINSKFNSIATKLQEINITGNRLDLGTYFYDYEIPDISGVIYEFKGTLNGKPSLIRSELSFAFI